MFFRFSFKSTNKLKTWAAPYSFNELVLFSNKELDYVWAKSTEDISATLSLKTFMMRSDSSANTNSKLTPSLS